MRSYFFGIMLLLSFPVSSYQQSVGVGTGTPHSSAILDIVSSTKGLGIPSMTSAQRNAIVSPKAGLFVFDTNMQTLCMYNGANWVYFQSSVLPNDVPPAEQVASDGTVGDEFGFSVAIDGNYAIVGAPFDNIGSNSDQGSAYIFFFNGTTWVEQAKLTATGGTQNDHFGYSVAINGDYVIVGAPDDDAGINNDQGSAYIFIRSGSTWTQQASITGAAATTGDNFGRSVSISGAYCAIGAPGDDVGANSNQGTAYVFIRSGTVWTQQDYVTLPGGASGDNFGKAVSISGNFLIVGAPNDEVSGAANAGSAHFFLRIGTNWSHEQVLTYSNSAFEFGSSVAVSGNFMVIGGPMAFSGAGRAYSFDGITWSNTPNGFVLGGIIALDPNTINGDQFGYSVAISGNNLIVGAPHQDINGSSSGIAYFIQSDGTDFYFVRNINDPLGTNLHLMGYSVGVSSSYAIVGSPYANGQRGKINFLKL